MKLERKNMPITENLHTYAIHSLAADYQLTTDKDKFFNQRCGLQQKLAWVGHGECPDCIYVEGLFVPVFKKTASERVNMNLCKSALRMLRKQIMLRDVPEVRISFRNDMLFERDPAMVLEYIQKIFEEDPVVFVVCN